MVPGPFRSLPGGDFEHTALVIQNAPKRSVFLIQLASLSPNGVMAALKPAPTARMSIFLQCFGSCRNDAEPIVFVMEASLHESVRCQARFVCRQKMEYHVAVKELRMRL